MPGVTANQVDQSLHQNCYGPSNPRMLVKIDLDVISHSYICVDMDQPRNDLASTPFCMPTIITAVGHLTG